MKLAQESELAERRRSPRQRNVLEGWLSPYASQDRTSVTTFDLSRDGVSFDAAFEIPIGAQYVYEIGFGKKSLICDIHIVSCRKISAGTWHIGAEFI